MWACYKGNTFKISKINHLLPNNNGNSFMHVKTLVNYCIVQLLMIFVFDTWDARIVIL
jgi:hypothetical protein